MKTIQPFIDLGFYTVPLKGELKRLEDGSKTTPIFEKNWRVTYQDKFNDKATAIGGVITGAISNIIAIDCDDQETYDLFCALDPNNTFHFISKGKPKGGGTIIYRYVQEAGLENFRIQSSIMHLDFYTDNGFVYLPTDENTTKEPWIAENFDDIPSIIQPPKTVLTLLRSLQQQYTLAKTHIVEDKPEVHVRANYLAPQVELFIAKKQFMPSLFRVITPKDFRDLPQYVQYGYLHPDNIPEGRGSEYLSKVSAILGADPSISPATYRTAIELVNSLWANPLPKARLDTTIINPMIEGKASIDGDPIWCYDEHWSTRGMAFTTKIGDAAEVFYDDMRAAYFFINYTADTTRQFYKDTDLFGYIEPIATALPDRKDVKNLVPIVRTSMNPSMPFGFYSLDPYIREFNLFKQSPSLAILNNPEHYAPIYKRPNNILQFIESLVPDDTMRMFLLQFIKTKFVTFEYSPIILYFIGAHGSGKDTLVSLLASIIGSQYLARPTAKEFLEPYNGWMMDKYFVQLDEYGNQLQTLKDKQEALGKIKAYSGKPEMQIRQMRMDGYNYKHKITLMLTANSNPLILEDGDRRVALIETPNVLKNEQWVITAGGVTKILDAMREEVNDFCYYLATEIAQLSRDEYMNPPDTTAKREIIASKMPAAQRLTYYCQHRMFNNLEELALDNNVTTLFKYSAEGRIFEEDLLNLYTSITEGHGTSRGLSKVFTEAGFTKIPTTREGLKSYYYIIPGLEMYKPTYVFTDESQYREPTNVKGL